MNIKEIASTKTAEMPLDDLAYCISQIQTGKMPPEQVFKAVYISGYLRSHGFPEPPEEAMKALLDAAEAGDLASSIVAAYKMGYLLKP